MKNIYESLANATESATSEIYEKISDKTVSTEPSKDMITYFEVYFMISNHISRSIQTQKGVKASAYFVKACSEKLVEIATNDYGVGQNQIDILFETANAAESEFSNCTSLIPEPNDRGGLNVTDSSTFVLAKRINNNFTNEPIEVLSLTMHLMQYLMAALKNSQYTSLISQI
jgi:hypothetical protein